jgi:hypothetical protein
MPATTQRAPYIGEVRYRGEVCLAQHTAILYRDLFRLLERCFYRLGIEFEAMPSEQITETLGDFSLQTFDLFVNRRLLESAE